MTEAIEFHNECSKECSNCILLSGNILIYYMQNIVPVAEWAGLSINLSLNHEGKVRCLPNDISCDRYCRASQE